LVGTHPTLTHVPPYIRSDCSTMTTRRPSRANRAARVLPPLPYDHQEIGLKGASHCVHALIVPTASGVRPRVNPVACSANPRDTGMRDTPASRRISPL